MDIFDRYLLEEPKHIPLLVEFLRNKESKSEAEIFSNLFNFNVNYLLNEVLIQDEVGLFSSSEEERELILSFKQILSRIKKYNEQNPRFLKGHAKRAFNKTLRAMDATRK